MGVGDVMVLKMSFEFKEIILKGMECGLGNGGV